MTGGASTMTDREAQRGRKATLATRRLVLRAFLAADAERLAELLDDFGVAGNLAHVPFPYAPADARRWLDSRPAVPGPRETAFAVATAADGLIGSVGFREESVGTVLGFWFGRPHWGQGYATEAAAAALAWYFDATGDERIASGAFADNPASLAIQTKLGFVETGRSMVHCLARGSAVEHVDTVLARPAFDEACRHLKVANR